MHVIPVEKEVDMCNESISIEHISHWLDKYEGKYAASPCSCRRSRMTYDEGCADDFHDWCIAVGDMADYVVETGKGGRYITKEEAISRLSEDLGEDFLQWLGNEANPLLPSIDVRFHAAYANTDSIAVIVDLPGPTQEAS